MLEREKLRELAQISQAVAFWLLALVSFGTVLTQSAGMTDFRSYYVAGELIRHAPQTLYSVDAQFAAQSKIGGGSFFPWAHLPPEALLITPLTFLSFSSAFEIWKWSNLVLLMIAAGLLKPHWRGYSAFAVALCPLTIGLHAGQDVFILLVAFVAGFVSLIRGHQFAAGCLIGIGLLRFTIAIPFLLFFAVARRWKVLSGAAVMGTFLAVISFGCVGRSFPVSYLRICQFLASSHDSLDSARMPTVRGFLIAVIGYHPHLYIAVFVASGLVLLWGLRRSARWNTGADASECLFAFAMAVSLVLDYQGYIYNMALLLVPATVLLRHRPDASKYLLFCTVATFCVALWGREMFGFLAPLFLWIAVLIQGEKEPMQISNSLLLRDSI